MNITAMKVLGHTVSIEMYSDQLHLFISMGDTSYSAILASASKNEHLPPPTPPPQVVNWVYGGEGWFMWAVDHISH